MRALLGRWNESEEYPGIYIMVSRNDYNRSEMRVRKGKTGEIHKVRTVHELMALCARLSDDDTETGNTGPVANPDRTQTD